MTPEPDDNPDGELKRALAWSGVVLLNVPLSLFLGVAATSGHGTVGMGVGVVFVWAAGLVIGRVYPDSGRALTRGGLVVAAVQPLFFCHFFLGAVTLGVWQWVRSMTLFREQGLASQADGFAVTLLMAQPLLLAAWVFGGGLKTLFAPAVARTAEEADYIDPERPVEEMPDGPQLLDESTRPKKPEPFPP